LLRRQSFRCSRFWSAHSCLLACMHNLHCDLYRCANLPPRLKNSASGFVW
jgi:hypothetical protein